MKGICRIDIVYLQEYLSKIFGTEYIIKRVSKVHGGAQKTVYKIDCTNKFSCILYLWDIIDNYFKEEKVREHENERSFGSDLFQINNEYFFNQGITSPILYDLNDKREAYPFDFALVEFVEGEKLESYLDNSLPDSVQEELLIQVGSLIQKMHSVKGNTYGNLLSKDSGKNPCHQIQLMNAKEHLIYTSLYLEQFENNFTKLNEVLQKLELLIVPRNEYGFIHWELGPDHILVNDEMEPFLINIEGAKFYDLEYEHSFLKIRFGEQYQYLKDKSLDPNRMLFYRFYHHISLTAGGLKLLNRGFPNQSFAKLLIDYHSKSVLRFLEY
ncbi:phosphotransferase [Salipaludibacillus sp. HK11]|uniref:phosphotransferase n=1 Tax=Salipaludibacillus sp. HK11 TaxID=3394320 RepID=UPI0039FBED86